MRLPVQPAHLPTGAECERMRRLEAVYEAAGKLLDARDELREAHGALEALSIVDHYRDMPEKSPFKRTERFGEWPAS